MDFGNWTQCCISKNKFLKINESCERSGPVIVYEGDKVLSYFINYEKNKKNGKYLYFGNEGLEKISGEFTNDKPSGTWTARLPSGAKIRFTFSTGKMSKIVVNREGGDLTYPVSVSQHSEIEPASGRFFAFPRSKPEGPSLEYLLIYDNPDKKTVSGIILNTNPLEDSMTDIYTISEDKIINMTFGSLGDPWRWIAYGRKGNMCQIQRKGRFMDPMPKSAKEEIIIGWVECKSVENIVDFYKRGSLGIGVDEKFYDLPNGKLIVITPPNLREDLKQNDAGTYQGDNLSMYGAKILETKTVNGIVWVKATLSRNSRIVGKPWVKFHKGVEPAFIFYND
jgi:hypothetical protein